MEYRALGVLMWLLPAYVVFWLGLALVIMIPWSYRVSVSDIIQYQQPGNLNPGWYVSVWKKWMVHIFANFWPCLRWASFLVVSGYGNCGLNLLDQNMIRR